MNIEEIKSIVNSSGSDSIKRALLIQSLANSNDAIPLILEVLNTEREIKKGLILDMNLELSRAHIYIDERPEVKSEEKQRFNKSFINDEIAKFYLKYRGKISHCFSRFI